MNRLAQRLCPNYLFSAVVWLLAICTVLPSCISQDLPPIEYSYLPGPAGYGRPSDIIQDDNGLLWLGYLTIGTGVFLYDGVSLTGVEGSRVDSTALSDNYVFSICKANDGKIWLGTWREGVSVYDPATDLFKWYKTGMGPGSLRSNTVNHVYKDKAGQIWCGTDNGLSLYVPAADTFATYNFPWEKADSAAHFNLNRVHRIVPDPGSNDVLWLCTSWGLVEFNIPAVEFTLHPMPFSARKDHDFPNDQYLLLDGCWMGPDDIWVGSWGGGIMHYNLPSKSWAQYIHKPGVINEYNIYHRLYSKDVDELWVCSYYGFGTFNINTLQFQYYDSLPVPQPNRRGGYYATSAYFFNERDLLVMGATGGALVHFVGKEAEQPLWPPLVRSVSVDGDQVPRKHTRYMSERVALSAEEQSLEIQYRSPYFHQPDSLWYRHQLSSHDASWQVQRGRGIARYDNVRGGKATFQYQVSLNGVSWIDGDSWTVSKALPFWNHPGVVYLIGGSAVILIMVVMYLRSVQKRKHQQLELSFRNLLAESEMSALRAQMNPHFIFNSLNSIKSYVLKQETHIANQYLTKFSHLMRLVLRNSKSRLISLTDELEALELYIEIERMRFDGRFSYDIDVEETLDTDDFYIPPMLVQPYVENAIWHGLLHSKKDGILKIALKSPDQHMLQIEIEDNGIGRDAASKASAGSGYIKKSYGTKITGDRIELLRHSLGIDTKVVTEDLSENGTASGTRVVLIIPLIDPAMKKKIDTSFNGIK